MVTESTQIVTKPISYSTLSSDIIFKSIVFISDLHFDFTKGKFKAKAASKMKDDFVSFILERYSNCLLCLAGDFFNDFRKTLAFINELESKKVNGFCVLGNHDYWSNGEYTHDNIIDLFDEATKYNKHFRLLLAGRKYTINDICVIGDTGWTSFKRGKGRAVSLKQFMRLPDARNVKDFNLTQIQAFHHEWVDFANKTLSQEKKVLIITHYPMVDFTKEDKDCWWSSLTELKGDNSWRIFGHTHQSKQQCDNNISSQRGYDNRSGEEADRFGQYSDYSFGMLEKAFEQYAMADVQTSIISKFYSPLMVCNPSKEVALISAIKRRGFKRCSANKENFAALATTPDEYLDRVNQVINWYLKDAYIGYTRTGGIPRSVIESVFAAIAVLRKNDFSDIREFITAAVITGYVYNGMPFLIERMRPLDDYDVMRFWLMFLTMKQYDIGIDSVYSVRKSDSNYIAFGDVDIYFPAVNDLALTAEDAQQLMQKTPLLPQPQTALPEMTQSVEPQAITSSCRKCGQVIIIEFRGNPETCNDYGNITVDCLSCGERNFIQIGRGVSLIAIRSGAKLKRKYASLKLD